MFSTESLKTIVKPTQSLTSYYGTPAIANNVTGNILPCQGRLLLPPCPWVLAKTLYQSPVEPKQTLYSLHPRETQYVPLGPLLVLFTLPITPSPPATLADSAAISSA